MILSAERIVLDGVPRANMAIDIDPSGKIRAVAPTHVFSKVDQHLPGRVLLPGLVNSHSHAFQRLLRGRTQQASQGGEDNFWSWRTAMYSTAAKLTPESVYVATRQMYLEMLLAGTTSVGEFHYIHHQSDGTPYPDAREMSEAVMRAARDVGIRLCLLRAVYLTGDFDAAPAPHQRRFVDASLDKACEAFEALQRHVRSHSGDRIGVGLAPHSLRAVPIDAMVALKTRYGDVPFHIHVAEQEKEVAGSLRTHGKRPIELLCERGVVDSLTTLVHATHVVPNEIQQAAHAGATVCVCPSTEADLGDGLTPSSDWFASGARLALGTDGHTLSSVFEEARRLEMNERLRHKKRNVLPATDGSVSKTLLAAATTHGGHALKMAVGEVRPGMWADLVAVDLNDPHLAGSDDTSLLANLMFSADSRSVTDVIEGGSLVVRNRQHALTEMSGAAFSSLCKELYP